MKHIEIKHPYVREAIQNKHIKLEYSPTKEMIADLLMKPLPRDQFETLRKEMGLEFLLFNLNQVGVLE